MTIRGLGLVLLTVLSVGLWLTPAGGQQQSGSGAYVPGEIIVKFARSVSPARRGALMAARAATITRRFEELELDHVRLPAGRAIADALAELRNNPEIVFAQPNFVYRAVTAPPNDPHWLDNSLWGLQKIAALEAWQAFGSGNGSVIVADIDTGVEYTHPDLAANMWRNPGEIAGNNIDDDLNGYADDIFGIDPFNHDSDPMDDHGHGTHTAGTIAGVGNNGIGVVGVNWNAKILACKFMNAAGIGSDAGAVECFNYIIALKNRGENIRVSSNSWGAYRGSSMSQALKDAVDAAGGAGVVNVFAAGNDSENIDVTPFDPASFPSSSVVSVAASDQSDNRAGFSNYGVSSVDLAAPGVGIRSTLPGGIYGDASGTSMATPHVAGVAALLASLDPTLSADNLKVLLMQNVDVLPQWSGLVASGGRLNAFRAAGATGAPPPGRVNVALAANGGTVTASSTYSSAYAAAGAINGDRRGQPWGAGAGWNDGTPEAWPDWLEISFTGTHTIDEIDIFSVQDNYAAPSDPTAGMTFSLYGLRSFEVQYWSGAAWLPVPGGTITDNTLVWRQLTFAPIATSKVRIWVTAALNSWSRIAEVEAYAGSGAGNSPPIVTLTAPADGATYAAGETIALAATADDVDGTVSSVAFYANGALLGTDTTSPFTWSWPNVAAGTYVLTAIATDDDSATTPSNSATVTVTPVAPPPGRVNVALAANGGMVTASSAYSSAYAAAGAINGDRRGQPWGAGAGWNDGTPEAWPDWLEISFNGTPTIDEIDIFSVQDNYAAPSDPTAGMTFSLYGLRSFEIQYWSGAAWLPVPGGTITDNTLVWRQLTFAPIATSKIRIWVTAALNSWSRIAEVEAYAGSSPTLSPPAISPSTITLRADFVGTLGAGGNATSPIAVGSHLLLLKQLGSLSRWDGATPQEILTRASAPAEVMPVGDEAVLNVAANAAGTSVFVMFTSSGAPAAIPTYTSPRPANAWQVLCRYDFNGNALSNPQALVAFQVNMYGHTGGGMVVLDDGSVLFATGDSGDSGEDGRQYAQDPANHLSKILRINPSTSVVTVVAAGVRNVQRLFVNPNSGDPRLEFADLGGAIAEEFNSVRLADLLVGPVENFGWGRNSGDNLAREGTFYIDPGGSATGAAPTPEAGFVQPLAQFGREGAQLVGVTGTVSSAASFTTITAVFGDLPTGNVLAVTGAPGTSNQTVYRVSLVDSTLASVTLAGLAGGRPDPRFFQFQDGTAGVLLERTGAFYRLTQISQ